MEETCSSETVVDFQRLGFDSWHGQDFPLLQSVQTSSGAHPASYPMGNEGFFQGVKRQEHKADHSTPSSAEVKKGGAIAPLPYMSLPLHGIISQKIELFITTTVRTSNPT
jgi:hypothetical protein